MLERKRIVDMARGWLGVRYRHQGRSKERGVDCVGLILGVGAELDLQLIAPQFYAESPSSNLVLRYADQQLNPIESRELALGRVAILWGFDRNEAQHLAIVGEHAGRLTMIHSFSKAGKVLEHSWDSFWMKRLVRVYEFPGTAPLEEKTYG
ncbi:C40 family peptidase [Nitratireductor sp. OM-1]|uniref:C40 family peptidase n=1 Tax=Nitratireductor sp. OM-1 TaxID=1756988 RepID=UPI000DDF6DA3|nr:C40 family peptidase [Nitratireductor sp. OM-1]